MDQAAYLLAVRLAAASAAMLAAAARGVSAATAPVAQAPVHQDALRPAGLQAQHILDLWHVTLTLCAVVFVAVLGACLLALWRAPRASEQTAPDLAGLKTPERRLHRSVAWATALSFAGLVFLLVADLLAGRALAQLPAAGAVRIELTGHQWWWEARYLDEDLARSFSTANELHLPVGRAAIITLRSDDVIHTFWVPGLHGKKDMIPGRSAELRLRADQPGVYRGQCAEFCGLEHAQMAMLVVAESPEAYGRWAAGQRAPAAPPSDAGSQRGLRVFMDSGCASCHAIAGTEARGRLGPDLSHLASRQTIAAGALPNQRGHLGGWIVDAPRIKRGAAMPPNVLHPDDLQALLDYLEDLQ
ncbi:c-type cytochrome [Oxalobacteraceae bacterium A2-2]